jgi:hypothetical protein
METKNKTIMIFFFSKYSRREREKEPINHKTCFFFFIPSFLKKENVKKKKYFSLFNGNSSSKLMVDLCKPQANRL